MVEERVPRGWGWEAFTSMESWPQCIPGLENPLVVIYLLTTAFSRTIQRYQDDNRHIQYVNSPKCSTSANEKTLLKGRRTEWERQSLFSLSIRPCGSTLKVEGSLMLTLCV